MSKITDPDNDISNQHPVAYMVTITGIVVCDDIEDRPYTGPVRPIDYMTASHMVESMESIAMGTEGNEVYSNPTIHIVELTDPDRS